MEATAWHRKGCAHCEETWAPVWSLRQKSVMSHTESFPANLCFLKDQMEICLLNGTVFYF